MSTNKQRQHKHDNKDSLQLLAGKEVITLERVDHNMFVLTAGKETMKNTVGRSLLEYHTKNVKVMNEPNGSSDIVKSDTNCKLCSPDCILLVAGRKLHCHKLILFHRSPVLKERIESEEYPSYGGEDQNKIELILPSISFEVARCLVCFLYTDDIETSNLSLAFFEELKKGAKYLALPRLRSICHIIIENLKQEMEGYSTDQNSLAETDNIEIDSSSISRDFKKCLFDKKWTDVKFVTNSSDMNELFAHKLILASRSSYFKNLFSQDDSYDSRTIITIEVPESYSSMLRFLTFLYTGLVVSESNDDLYQDIILASRYKLDDMIDSCDSMINVTMENISELLKMIQCSKISTPKLREKVINVIISNLSNSKNKSDEKEKRMISNKISIEEILKDYSDLLTEFVKTEQDRTASNYKLRFLQNKLNPKSAEQKLSMHIENTTSNAGLTTILYLLGSCAAYFCLLRAFVALRPLVPVYVINIVFMCFCAYLAMYNMDIN